MLGLGDPFDASGKLHKSVRYKTRDSDNAYSRYHWTLALDGEPRAIRLSRCFGGHLGGVDKLDIEWRSKPFPIRHSCVAPQNTIMIIHSQSIRGWAGLLVVALIFQLGCDIPERPPLSRNADQSSTDPISQVEEDEVSEPEETVFEFDGRWETWDAYFVGNEQVGYNHIKAEPRSPRATSDIRYTIESRIYLRQGDTRVLQDMELTSTESNTGQLVDFESVVRFGPVVSKASGFVDQGSLRVKTTRGNKATNRAVPWETGYRGLVALEQSLKREPMREKGERRQFKMLLPGQYVLATARMRCNGLASVPLLDGTQTPLVEINCEIEVGEGKVSYSIIWTDNEGAIVRSYSPGIRMIAYRTDEATALQVPEDDEIPLAVAAKGIDGERPSDIESVNYRITPIGRREFSLEFSPVLGQPMRVSGDGSVDVCRSRESNQPLPEGFVVPTLAPGLGDQDPNSIIDSDHPFLKRLSDAFALDDLPRQEAAAELARVASEIVTNSSEYKGIVAASDTAELGSADHVAKAILLAALLRSQEIPSRVVFGVIETPEQLSQGRMEFRAWTLAYADGDWIELDASEKGRASPNRIAFASTNFANGYDSAALATLMSRIRRIKIESTR